MRTSEFSIPVPESEIPTSAILEIPKGVVALLVLAHGAGAGMRHSAMRALAEALHSEKIATLCFNFVYMDRGSRRPDRPPLATATVAAAVSEASRRVPRLPIFAGGKSFGGRMTTTAAADEKIPAVRGIICFGFPLHPAKQPGTKRAEHLTKVTQPSLFIQGTRDDLADLKLIKKVVAKNSERIKIHVVQGANHSFSVLKSTGRTDADALLEVARAARDFVDTLL